MKSNNTAVEGQVVFRPSLDEYQLFIDGLRDGLFICTGNELLAYNKKLTETLRFGAGKVTLSKIINILNKTENATARNCIMRLTKGFNFGPVKMGKNKLLRLEAEL